MNATNAILEYHVAKPKSGDTKHSFGTFVPQDVELVVEHGSGEITWHSEHHDVMGRIDIDASSAEKAARLPANGHGVAFVSWSAAVRVLRIVYR